MKQALCLALVAWSAFAHASVSTEPPTKEYVFKFKYGADTYEIRKPAGSYDEAFERAADLCFKHFKSGKGPLTEEQGLDIIDACANPRS